MGRLKENVPLSDIRENAVALRTVDRAAESYLGLVESIKSKGFLGTITVREKKDENGAIYYEIVDGLHRFCAAKDAGLESIGVDITDLDEDQVLEGQILLNLHKIETKPTQYSQQLRRILKRNPTMTANDLASRLGKSLVWINARLDLTTIEDENIKTLIDKGDIKLANAYALAKLPANEMAQWVDRAMTMQNAQFVLEVQNRVKAIKEAARAGRTPGSEVWQPNIFFQKKPLVEEEMKTGAHGKNLINKHQVKVPMDAWNMAIKWLLHQDPESIAEQKAEHDERVKNREEAAAKRKTERDAAKAERDQAKAGAAADAQAMLTV